MGKIKIYTTPTCPYCHVAKNFFKKRGIAFEEIDVTKNKPALKEMIKKSGKMGVPQIEIKGRIIVGFNKKELEEALNEE